MQIDFHHTVTYVAARAAGFGHREGETIAYCAQYVDDAVNSGTIRFLNGAMYSRISSAHKMLDYRNFEKLANHHVWLPFHFLPGNGGLLTGVAMMAAGWEGGPAKANPGFPADGSWKVIWEGLQCMP